MKTSGTTSATTSEVHYQVDEITTIPMEIYDDWYDADLDRYIIIYRDQMGRLVNLRLSEKQIMRLHAFVQSEKAIRKYHKLMD